MQTLKTLLVIFLFFFSGFVFSRAGFLKFIKNSGRIINAALYVMLFFMGVKTGSTEGLIGQLPEIGMISFAFSAATAAGSILAISGIAFLTGRPDKSASKRASGSKEWMTLFKEPLLLMSIVVAGAVSGYLLPVFRNLNQDVVSWFLYLLLFFIGAEIESSRLASGGLTPILLLLPAATAAGSLAGGFGAGLFFDMSPGESLSLASGFGWYTLSGVLIADMGNPVLGSAGFFTNLFRETLALIMIPVLGRLRLPLFSIGIAGATSMDVTLPLIGRSCGNEYVPLAVSHGAILSMLVPFLVPLFFNL